VGTAFYCRSLPSLPQTVIRPVLRPGCSPSMVKGPLASGRRAKLHLAASPLRPQQGDVRLGPSFQDLRRVRASISVMTPDRRPPREADDTVDRRRARRACDRGALAGAGGQSAARPHRLSPSAAHGQQCDPASANRRVPAADREPTLEAAIDSRRQFGVRALKNKKGRSCRRRGRTGTQTVSIRR
jgi:hypothetical protein